MAANERTFNKDFTDSVIIARLFVADLKNSETAKRRSLVIHNTVENAGEKIAAGENISPKYGARRGRPAKFKILTNRSAIACVFILIVDPINFNAPAMLKPFKDVSIAL